MTVKQLTEHHLEFLSLTEGCKGSSESTVVKTPHCWKSHVMAHVVLMPLVKFQLNNPTYSLGDLSKMSKS